VKIWAHVIATVVGLALAGLIVFLVFGNASREGALNEDTVVRGSADGSKCGTITVAEIATPKARQLAAKNEPSLVNQAGLARAFSDPAGTQWLARVQAAGGLCVDEVQFSERGEAGPTKVTLSTVDRVSTAAASAYTGAVFIAAGQAPFNRRDIVVVTFVGNQKRTISFSSRAYLAFIAQRRNLGLGSTVGDLIKFRRLFPGFASGIRINGWS